MEKEKSSHYFLLFYFNRKDKRIFVPKRYGMGWTLNLANPVAILLFVLIFVVTYLLAK